MTKLNFCISFALILFCWLPSAHGQFSPATQIPEWKEFVYEYYTLSIHSVRKELELSEKQIKKVRNLYQEKFRALQFITRKMIGLEADSPHRKELIDEGLEFIEDARKDFKEAALPFQVRRFNQLAKQFEFFGSTGTLDINRVKSEFDLSDKEAKSLEETDEAFSEELKELNERFKKEALKLMKKRMKEFKQKLSAEHKKSFDKTFGDPFLPIMGLRIRMSVN